MPAEKTPSPPSAQSPGASGEDREPCADLDDVTRFTQGRDGSREALRRQARFLSHVIESLHHPFYVIDATDFTVRLANSAARFGDLEGRPTCYQLTHGRSEPCSGDQHVCPLETVRRTKRPATVEHIHYNAEGEPRNVEVHAHPIVDEQGKVVQMIEYALDITDRKKQEEERRLIDARLGQASKMEAIGTLAGGVAHDMNNMLAAILGSATLLQRENLSAELRGKLVRRIIEAAERGGAFTQSLLGFARRAPTSWERIDLATVVLPVVELLRRSDAKKQPLSTSLEPELPLVKGDAHQLSQAVMNLVLNALEASSPGGRVSVELRPCIVGGAEADRLADVSPGRYVELRVADEGVGMAPEILDRAMDPFFTTKPAGEGTGLGLSMAYSAVCSHGGTLRLASELGNGTVATVLLPALDATASPGCESKRELPIVVAPRGGTILIVDDEPLVRKATADSLESLGFDVLVADGGKAALQLVREHRGQIDLVVLDMLMPDMDGPEVFERLRAIEGHSKVLLCSGYARSGDVGRLLAAGAKGFLAKPFSLEQLSAAVTDALGR